MERINVHNIEDAPVEVIQAVRVVGQPLAMLKQECEGTDESLTIIVGVDRTLIKNNMTGEELSVDNHTLSHLSDTFADAFVHFTDCVQDYLTDEEIFQQHSLQFNDDPLDDVDSLSWFLRALLGGTSGEEGDSE